MDSPTDPQREIEELRERLARLEKSLQGQPPAPEFSPEARAESMAQPEPAEALESSGTPPPLPTLADMAAPSATPQEGGQEIPPPLPGMECAAPLIGAKREVETKTKSGLPGWPGLASAEGWLARIGVVLLVVGLLLFLKLALDRGWISEVVQLGLTALLSAGFCGLGWKLQDSRRSLAALLFGVGVAGGFGTILAGQAIYQIIPAGAAALLTVLVAVVAVGQSLRAGMAGLAVVGVLGGYGAVLYLGNPALQVPLSTLLGSIFFTTALFLQVWRGWIVLYFLGILLQAVLLSWLGQAHLDGRGYLMVGLFWFGLLGWISSLGPTAGLARGAVPSASSVVRESRAALLFFGALFPWAFAVAVGSWVWTGGLGGLGGEAMRPWQTGGYFLVGCLLTVTGIFLRRLQEGHTPSLRVDAQILAGQAFFVLSLVSWWGGNILMVLLAVQMLAVQEAGRRWSYRGLLLAGHLLAALLFGLLVAMNFQLASGLRPAVPSTALTLLLVVGAFLIMAWRNPKPQSGYVVAGFFAGVVLLWGWAVAEGWPVAESGLFLACWAGAFYWWRPVGPKTATNGRAVAYLIALVLALFLALLGAMQAGMPTGEGVPFFNREAARVLGILAIVSWVVRNSGSPTHVLRWTAYAIFLVLGSVQLWSWHGGVWVSPFWAACAIILMTAGVRQDEKSWRTGAMITLVILLARLFLVDLATLDPVWRTLIFLGTGGSLVAAAYFLPRWAGRQQNNPLPPKTSDPSDPPPPLPPENP